MIDTNLPALIVVVPLLAAALAPFTRQLRAAWPLTMITTIAVFVLSVVLLQRVLEHGTISYAMGNWAPPWGIEYRVDKLNAFVVLIVSAIALAVTPFARLSVAKEIASDRVHFFYCMYLLCITGLLGIVVTGDAFNLYVLLEVSSLSTYVLVAMGTKRHALKASFDYLVLGTIGATLLLIGIGQLYIVTGTLNMVDLAERLADLHDNRTVRTGFAFIVVGASLKLALFPLHAWLPGAYTHAPSTVAALLAGTSTKVGAYVLLRFIFTVFGVEFSFDQLQTDLVVLVLAVAAIFYGSLVAIRQNDVKRMLAYSSISQIGYIVLGVGIANATGLAAGIIHLFNHALIKTALFLALGCVFYRIASVNLEDMRGLGRKMPWTMAAFVGGGLSLIGVPLTAGFISKWYVVLAALERGWWPLAAVVLVGSLLAVVYVWRVVEAAYFQSAPKTPRDVREAPLSMLLPLWSLIAANVYFGLDASLTTGVALEAARSLLGGAAP
jgi:multicomponent Na+:H+ antiporter subunit D